MGCIGRRSDCVSMGGIGTRRDSPEHGEREWETKRLEAASRERTADAMERRRWGVGNACLVLLAMVVLAVPTACTERAPAFIARVASLDGDATVVRAAGEKAPAARGLQLAAGDRVETGAKSTASLQFADFATAVVGENSVFVIRSQETTPDGGIAATSSELLKGIGLVKVTPGKTKNFDVKTPHVVTGVLGTEYGLEVDEGDQGNPDDDATVLAVLSGRVRFAGGGGSLEVEAGDGARCDGHEHPHLHKHYLKMRNRLTESLQSFVKEGASTELKSIFRYY